MADIISFYVAARRLSKPAEADKPVVGPAQVLFFTGVRYERRDMEAQKKLRKRKPLALLTDAAIGS